MQSAQRVKKVMLIFISILLIFSFFSCGKKTIKIGFIGPLTGDYANYGKLMTQSVKIAVQEKNEMGGIGEYKIKLISEDSQGKVDKANSAIEKLASVNKVWGIIGPVFSGTSLAIAPKCETENIVMISPSATHKDLTSKGKYVFRNVLSDQLQAIVFAKYVSDVMGLKRVAILYIKNDYSQGLAGDFKRIFKSNGGTITAMESGLQGDKDFKTQLTKIKGTNPQAIFLPNYVADIAQMLEQSKQLGINVKMLSADGFSNPEIFELAGDQANGVIFSGPPEENEISESGVKKAFVEKYEQRWGEKPDSFSLNSYDGAKILLSAIEKVFNASTDEERLNLTLDRNKIKDRVARIKNYNGVSGKITFLDNGDALKNVGVFKVENSEYKQIAVYMIDKGRLVEVK